LLDNSGIDLNDIACMDFAREDREQFVQLVGYSHSGSSDLNYMSDEVWNAAQAEYEARTNAAECKTAAPTCTCPSGDGSLSHPCPAHPPEPKKCPRCPAIMTTGLFCKGNPPDDPCPLSPKVENDDV
jgi:hypothetical protein